MKDMTSPREEGAGTERVSDEMLRDMSRLDWSGLIYASEVRAIIAEIQSLRAAQPASTEEVSRHRLHLAWRLRNGDAFKALPAIEADEIKQAAGELEMAAAQPADDARDAERWRAFESSERLKLIGSAGFDWTDGSFRPRGERMHFGLEIWNLHSARDYDQGKTGRRILNAYVDELVRRRSLSTTSQGE